MGIASAQAAKVISIEEFWGISNRDLLIQVQSDLVYAAIQELAEYSESRMPS